ncbi:MAG: ADP-ribosylglycohydrolase family protein [Clostridiales bacterium]|jgi:ADP-ribosylglycohydrolase|nr:ADP-ribosylglycohydrolase family protein [Clostridiales bacterium]
MKIAYGKYYDKVLGAWLGKSLGGIVGAPFEAHKIKGDVRTENAWPAKIFPNDDLDIQVVWMELMEERGPIFDKNLLAGYWRERCWYNFAEYGYFLYNEQRGIHPPYSGAFNNRFYSECMGCPIRSEIWSVVNPGDPERAAKLAADDGSLDHTGNSVQAERFWAAAGAIAFTERDLKIVLDKAARFARGTAVHEIKRYAEELYAETRGDVGRAWQDMVRKYGHRDGSKVEFNTAATLYALYAGGGDFKRTVVTAVNFGWDCDCTAATAGALLGILNGAGSMLADWMQKMGDRLNCDVNVRHKSDLLTVFAADTCKIGLEYDIVSGKNRIQNAPAETCAEVRAKIAARAPAPKLTAEAVYCGKPALYAGRASEVRLVVKSSLPKQNVRVEFSREPEILLNVPDRMTVELDKEIGIDLKISLSPQAKILWDRNLIRVSITAREETLAYTFGLAGAKVWRIYGPYFEAWNMDESAECKFRNKNLISHPVFVEGQHHVLSHNFINLDREYLDESLLIKEDIERERPMLFQNAENRITSADICGFTGECAYYLTREIVSRRPEPAEFSFGSSVPLKAWLNGGNLVRNEKHNTWFPRDNARQIELGAPMRLVVKLASNQDFFEFSDNFITYKTDKSRGVSYLLDCTGTKLPQLPH